MSTFPIQRMYLTAAASVFAALFVQLAGADIRKASLLVIGVLMGVSLYHAAFGFTAAYRRAIVEKDISGVAAQCIMLALAMVLFAPALAEGELFGRGVGGAIAPVSVSMALGALLFGIGMQLAGGCGSGTLLTAGSGNLRMFVALAFFCIGGFWGSLDLAWWQQLPGIGSVALGRVWGWSPAVLAQLALLAVIYFALRKMGRRHVRPLMGEVPLNGQTLLRGPWPLLLSAGLLALLNWATLAIAGHPWSVTWAFALWAAKGATLVGWDPASSGFWADGFPARALARTILQDTTSVMNIGIMLGAMTAATLAGRLAEASWRIPWKSLLSAVLGGLMLGYGARLAYGCNIGAFFSGVASTSLHGWVWIFCAVVGNVIGVRMRPWFGLTIR
ncbi:MAG: YeeE/YedE family protein [Rhodospirillaceae bacterium]|jgi:uncharacterized protein|nr:YeeE/YedE family protein [Rhodospirillaceae bacterium]